MVPVSYSYRNLIVRWKTTFMTASGFVLVVAALTVMLAFVKGVETVCAISGEPENVIILSKGNADEVLSQIDSGMASQVEGTRGLARGSGGQPLASRELYMVVHHYKQATREFSFLQVRGVLPVSFDVHTRIKTVQGERFRPGQSEIMVGAAVQRDLGVNVGDTLPLGRKEWRVAGVFSAEGAAFETEVWCDLSELASQFRREGVYNSVVLRAPSGDDAARIAAELANSRTLSVEAKTELAYYSEQSSQMASIMTAAWVISWFMGIGAVFGVMNTMFAAINQRTKDIAVMRILGFKPGEILVSFLLEALLIAAIGGAGGASIGLAANGLTRTFTIGAREVEFAFKVDGPILLAAALFTLVMGLLGGLLPAMSAMRVRPIEALR